MENHKYKLELVTGKDMTDFVNAVRGAAGSVKLTDGLYCVNGKSLLGVAATIEWGSLSCISENDIYSRIERFIVK